MENRDRNFYINQKDLIYIKTIVEEGSVSQAAKKLYISQPSLSQVIRRMEEALEMPLFRRTARGLILTSEGEAYYQMAKKVLNLYDSFEEQIKNMEDLKYGTVKIGTTSHRGVVVLPKFLAEFHLKFPQIKVEILEMGTSELEEMLLCGKIDFGILRVPMQKKTSSHINYYGLTRENFVILLPKGHQAGRFAKKQEGCHYPVLDPKFLKEENILLPDSSMRLYENVMAILNQAGILIPKSSYASIYIDTLPYLTASGEGVCIVSEQLLNYHPEKNFDIYEIPKEYGAFWQSSLAVLKDGYLPRAAKVMIQEYGKFIGVDIKI